MKLIKGSQTDYVSKDGRIFKQNKNGELFEKALYTNPYNGYVYCGITYPSGNLTKRVHRLVATAYLENLSNLPIVGHKNNIKNDNRADNLYWTTVSENTKKAYDDGLAMNKSGMEDSQSIPIVCICDIGEIIYGSIREASRETDIPLSTIARRLKDNGNITYRKYKSYRFRYL